MNANDAHFLPFLGTANAQFVIPVYQRLYSWERKDCEVLWNDIVRAGKFQHTHFVGSMLYAPEAGGTLTGINRYLLIDGQQRMTTLTLILAALIQYLSANESKADFLDMSVGGLRRLYLFDNDRKGDSRYKLILSQDDRETLFSIVGDAAMPANPSRLIVENYEYFVEKMAEPTFDPELLWVGLGQLLIVDTKLGADDNAQLIFESMNSKGKPLTATDLIRNYILMSLPNDEQTRLYESYWHPMEQMFGQSHDREINEFFWNWLWLKIPNRKPRKDEVYDEFKIYLGDNPETKSEDLLIDLLASADHYTRIFGDREPDKDLAKAFKSFNRLDVNAAPETKSEDLLIDLLASADHYTRIFGDREPDKDLAKAFKSFNRLDVNAARLLLMELYTQYDSGNLSKEEFIYLVKTIESFLFRRSICGRLTTGLNHYFAGLAKQLDSVEIVEHIIGNLLAQDENKTAYFPTDEYFEEQFLSRDCYNRFGDKCAYFLESIENHHRPKEPDENKTAYFPTDEYFEEQFLSRDCYNRFGDKCAYFLESIENHHRPKEPISVSSYQIEHVLPQTITNSPEWQNALGEDWEHLHELLCNNLGNLTLTGYNQEYSNKPFEFKLNKPDDGFACSPLYLNRLIAEERAWNADSIKRRASKLMEDAKTIWPYPIIDESVIAKYRPQKTPDGITWTIEEHHPWMAEGGPCRDLFAALKSRLYDEFPTWKEDVRKYYIGFKDGKRLTLSVQDRKTGKLVLGFRDSIDSFDDPKGICVDKRAAGGIGPGMRTMVVLEHESELDDVVKLLKQVSSS